MGVRLVGGRSERVLKEMTVKWGRLRDQVKTLGKRISQESTRTTELGFLAIEDTIVTRQDFSEGSRKQTQAHNLRPMGYPGVRVA